MASSTQWRLLAAVGFCLISGNALAESPSNAELQRQIEELKQQIRVLSEKLSGQPPAAQPELSKQVETQDQQIKAQQQQIETLAKQAEETKKADWIARTKLGGYGELHYNNLDAEDSARDLEEFDFHRFVLFLSHTFNDDIRFFSELEIEHSGVEADGSPLNGEVELEQAYVEFDLLNDKASAKAGLFLIPIGILNETHEPPTFYGVERNDVENVIIPATWWAGGAGYTHRLGEGLQWDVALHEGLRTPVTGGSAFRIRDGRQKTSFARAEDLALTNRIKYTAIPGVELGASVQLQKDASQIRNDSLEQGVLYEAHVDLKRGAFGLRTLYAKWDLDIDEDLALAALVPQDQIDRAKSQKGWYLEPSYRLNPEWGVYARYEDIEAARSSDNFNQWEAGFNYWPHPSVVLKMDYRSRTHELDADEGRDFDGFDLGVGYQF
jgi:hypothetical protein